MRATIRPFRTRFRSGSTYRLNLATHIKSPNHDAKGTLSDLPCGVVLELLVDMWFQVLLTPLTGVLFTFPSRYLSTIGRSVVFSLTRWSWQIQTGLHVSRLTWVPRSAPGRFRVRGCHALWRAFPGASASNPGSYRGPATPMPLA